MYINSNVSYGMISLDDLRLGKDNDSW